MRDRLPSLTAPLVSSFGEPAWPSRLHGLVESWDRDRLRFLAMRAVRAIVIAGVSLIAAGCDTVCDEVAEEAEASGCAQGLPEDDEGAAAAQADCSGQRERYAECLLDFADNVCFINAEEAQAVEACMNGGGS